MRTTQLKQRKQRMLRYSILSFCHIIANILGRHGSKQFCPKPTRCTCITICDTERSHFKERGRSNKCPKVDNRNCKFHFLKPFSFRNLYKGYEDNTEDGNKKKQNICKRFSKIYNPAAALTFVFFYWAIGLKNAQYF